MAFNVSDFSGNIVGLTVGVIIVTSVAIPVILTAIEGIPDDSPAKTILEVLPVFLVIGVLMACVALFITKKKY